MLSCSTTDVKVTTSVENIRKQVMCAGGYLFIFFVADEFAFQYAAFCHWLSLNSLGFATFIFSPLSVIMPEIKVWEVSLVRPGKEHICRISLYKSLYFCWKYWITEGENLGNIVPHGQEVWLLILKEKKNQASLFPTSYHVWSRGKNKLLFLSFRC